MTLVDTNLLVYATFAGAPAHCRARTWLEQRLAAGETPVALCWPVLYAFEAFVEQPAVRLVTAARGPPRSPPSSPRRRDCGATTFPTTGLRFLDPLAGDDASTCG